MREIFVSYCQFSVKIAIFVNKIITVNAFFKRYKVIFDAKEMPSKNIKITRVYFFYILAYSLITSRLLAKIKSKTIGDVISCQLY